MSDDLCWRKDTRSTSKKSELSLDETVYNLINVFDTVGLCINLSGEYETIFPVLSTEHNGTIDGVSPAEILVPICSGC